MKNLDSLVTICATLIISRSKLIASLTADAMPAVNKPTALVAIEKVANLLIDRENVNQKDLLGFCNENNILSKTSCNFTISLILNYTMSINFTI